jgi:hypothetical protein
MLTNSPSTLSIEGRVGCRRKFGMFSYKNFINSGPLMTSTEAVDILIDHMEWFIVELVHMGF